MNVPVIVLLLQGIPEGISITTLAFVIAKIPLRLNKIVLIGTTLAICANVLRRFPIPLGVHTIMSIFILFLILTLLSKGDVWISFMASILSCLILVIFETACISLLMPVFRISFNTLATDYVYKIILGDTHVLLLFCSAFLLNKFIHRKSYLGAK